MNNENDDIYKEIILIKETLSAIDRIDKLMGEIDIKLTSIENTIDRIEKINL